MKALVLCAVLGVTGLVATPDRAPVFLSADVSEFTTLLPAPPSDDSPAGRADLAVVLRLQAERTPAQEARVKELAAHTPFQMGAVAFGPGFTPENLPETAKFFQAVRDQSRPAILATKSKWSRARPYFRDARVQPCAPKPKSTSYPSGHSIEATLWAAILTAAFPDKAERFEAEVQDTMWSRIVGGVHYPSDTQAGYLFGKALAEKMLASPDMQSALVTIRAEVAGLTQPRRDRN